VDVTFTDPSAGAYTKHIESYQEMEQNLKMYVFSMCTAYVRVRVSHIITSCLHHSFIYPVTIGTDMPSVIDYKYGVEQLFIDLLQDSHFSVPAKVSWAVGIAFLWKEIFSICMFDSCYTMYCKNVIVDLMPEYLLQWLNNRWGNCSYSEQYLSTIFTQVRQ